MVAQPSAFRFPFHVVSQSSQASEVTLGRFLCSRCVLPAQKSLPELHLDRLYHTTTLALSTFFRWMALRQAKKFASKGLRQDRSMRSHGRIPYAGFDICGVSRGMRRSMAFGRALLFLLLECGGGGP
jgi:hypothetical protein